MYKRQQLHGAGRRVQLDGDDPGQVVHGGTELARGGPAHGDVVLLHRGGRDGVGGRRDREPLHLADQGGLGVLGDHQPRVDPGVVREERRQPVRPVLVEQPVGAALADRAEVGGDDREEVQDVRDGRAVEVAVGLDPAVGKNHRIVDGGGQFAARDDGGVVEGVAARAVDLGGAADRVGVLDPGRVVLVMAGQSRTGEHAQHVVRARALTGVRADGVQLGGEHLVRAEQRLQGEGGGDVGGGVEVLQVGEGHDQHAEHAVRAVEEGKALLLPQFDGGDAVRGEEFAGGPDRAVGALRLALAHQGERAVRERREVAGAAEGTVLVDHGRDARVQHVGHGLRDLGAHAGVTGGDRLQPEEHQRAHDLALDAGAHARRVRADDVALEPRPQVGADVAAREGAEAGGDAVDRLGLGRERVHDEAGGGQGVHGGGGELDPGAVAGHGDDVLGGGSGRPHHDSVHIHIQQRTD